MKGEDQMGFISYFDSKTFKSILRVSNYWAMINRNQYPQALTNALSILYDWVPCPCDDQCLCRTQFSCTHHYVRKSHITFDIAKTQFLSCYIDAKIRHSVSLGTKEGRAKNAVEATSFFQSKWDELYTPLTTHLLCTNWFNDTWRMIGESFKPDIDTIYKAKWMALLALDTFVAYDTASIRLLKREYRGRNFFDFMSAIRTDLLNHLRSNAITLATFRTYDNPNEFYPNVPHNHPRPIGNIIDKIFLTL